jgi:glycosyltransferase involved in cell wall biosynthesis
VAADGELREAMIAKGYANLARFRWETAAAQTMDVLETTVHNL